jgi:hypothetical protein
LNFEVLDCRREDKTIFLELNVVDYCDYENGCRRTWCLTLREEHALMTFENSVLRRIFGPKRDKVAGEWRKLHNGELHKLYSSPDIIRQIKSKGMR